jgi:hypothetical protein
VKFDLKLLHEAAAKAAYEKESELGSLFYHEQVLVQSVATMDQ